MDHSARNLAVFIDFENCAKAPAFDLELMMARLKERGRLLIKRAYADWGRFSKDKGKLARASISLIELPSHGGRGKNSADIALVVDALEATTTRPHIDTLVVVSGDSDYTPLYTKVRELGKRVIVIGPQNGTSAFVKDYCDELLYFSALAGKSSSNRNDAKETYPILLAALRAIADEGREAKLSLIKSRMKQLDASFDESNYGIAKFSKYLAKAEQDGVIEITRHPSGDWTVTDGDDGEPTEEDVEAPSSVVSGPRPQVSDSSVEKLLRNLRKRAVTILEPAQHRAVVDRIVDSTDPKDFPRPRQDLNSVVQEWFEDDIERGGLSKTKVRRVLELLVKAGAFAQNRVERGEDSYTEIAPTFGQGDRVLVYRLHDAFLLDSARSYGIELDQTARAVLLLDEPKATRARPLVPSMDAELWA
jgi:uncharacterized protein (TIGR00288 family)